MPSSPSLTVNLASRVASACAIAALALCASAIPARAAADPSLEIVGGTKARTVRLQTCPNGSAGCGPAHSCTKREDGSATNRGQPYRGGQLTIRVRNGSAAEKTLNIRYLRDDTGSFELSRESEPVFLTADSKKPPTVEGKESLSLSIGFAVLLGESAAAIDGRLAVSTGDEKPLVVPVSVEDRSFKGVTIAPTTLPMDTDEREVEVTLEGPELVEYLRSHGGEEPSAILYGDGSDTSEATLKLPRVGDVENGEKSKTDVENGNQGISNENRATATVALADADPAAGKYTGKLSLPDLPADARSVSIELHAHDHWLVLLGLVLLGVIATGIGSRLVTTAARRRLLTEVLRQTYDVFLHVVRGGETKSWSLDDLLAEDPKEEGPGPTPEAGRLQGLSALRDSIATARSSADLDEDADRALDMIARMQRWLRVEPLARRLALVAATRSASGELPAEGENGKDKDKNDGKPALSWTDSKTLRDTRALLEMARREPADASKADDLVARLLFQINWHNSMATAWNAAAGRSDLAKEARALDEALGDASKAGERKLEEQNGLDARLDGLLSKLPEGTTVPEIKPIKGEPVEPEGRELGITPVKWDASSNLFTGWATLDGKSYGQLTRRAATSSRALYMPSPADLWQEVKLLRLPDLYWTLAILAFASATYSASAYSNTWGSCTDLATAFLAGVGGKVVVNWAALPIFQSFRLRKTKTA